MATSTLVIYELRRLKTEVNLTCLTLKGRRPLASAGSELLVGILRANAALAAEGSRSEPQAQAAKRHSNFAAPSPAKA